MCFDWRVVLCCREAERGPVIPIHHQLFATRESIVLSELSSSQDWIYTSIRDTTHITERQATTEAERGKDMYENGGVCSVVCCVLCVCSVVCV